MVEKNIHIDTSVKIEIVGLLTGIIALFINIIIIINWENLDTSIRELFRGGHTGGMIVGVSAIVGFCSSLLCFVNLLVGKRRFWSLRLIAIFAFLGFGAILSSLA